MSLAHVALLGLLAGVLGTGSGGLIVVITHKRIKLPMSALLGFSAGVMLAVVFHELIPEALEDGGFSAGMLGMIVGVSLMLLFDYALPHVHLMADGRTNSYVRTGILLGLGIALHNFPEGLAIGTSFAHDEFLGYTIAVVLALHNLPEGMAMAILLSVGNVPPLRVWGYTMLAGLPMGAGALLGGWMGSISPLFLGFGLGFAAGAMLYITCHELIPGAQSASRGYAATFGIVVGVIVGIAML